MMMPKYNDWDVIQEIRERSEVPALMLTVLGDESNEINGLLLGADDYITKPFKYGVFLARIESLTRKARKAKEKNLNADCIFIEQRKQSVQEHLEEECGDIDAYIEEVADESGSRIILLDKSWNIVAVSYYQREDGSNIPVKKIQKMEKKRGNDAYICEIFDMKKESYSKMILLSETKQEQYLVLMRNTNGMRKSAVIANEFHLLTGGLLLLAGAAAAIIFSRKITVPILEICEITSEVSELCFERRIEEKGTDEISELRHSINVMSDKLEYSIHALNEDILQRKQLVRDMSHELKTPIAVIQGYADGLLYGVAEDETKRKRYCRVIASECERMDEMVKDLLELSKLEQAAVQTDIEIIELYPFLHTLAQRYEKVIEEKKFDLQLVCDEAMSVMADKKLLERAMVNLLFRQPYRK